LPKLLRPSVSALPRKRLKAFSFFHLKCLRGRHAVSEATRRPRARSWAACCRQKIWGSWISTRKTNVPFEGYIIENALGLCRKAEGRARWKCELYHAVEITLQRTEEFLASASADRDLNAGSFILFVHVTLQNYPVEKSPMALTTINSMKQSSYSTGQDTPRLAYIWRVNCYVYKNPILNDIFDKVWVVGLLYKLTIPDFPSRLVTILSSDFQRRPLQSATPTSRDMRTGMVQDALVSRSYSACIVTTVCVSDNPAPSCRPASLYADDTNLLATPRKPSLVVGYLEMFLTTLEQLLWN
jgi:hypothetical protein